MPLLLRVDGSYVYAYLATEPGGIGAAALEHHEHGAIREVIGRRVVDTPAITSARLFGEVRARVCIRLFM